jgi:transposase
MLLLSRKEKEKIVIKLATEGKTIKKIAKAVHISLKDVAKILRKVTGDEDNPAEKEKEEEKKQKRLKSLFFGQAFLMFKDKKSLVYVVIELDQETNTILNYYRDFLRLVRMDSLIGICKDLNDEWPLFIHLYR